MPYYRFIYKDGLQKFVRFTKNVWNVSSEGKEEDTIALEGIKALENFLKELAIPQTILKECFER